MVAEKFEIFAVKYAERTGYRGEMFVRGDPHEGPLDMDYFIWALRSPSHTIVVDTGFGEPEARERKRTFLRDPATALALIGIDAANVTDVVLTHLHYDHAGNLGSFPNAAFHVQEAEVHYVTGRSMTHRSLRHSFRLEDVLELVRNVYAERVVFHRGDDDLVPGVTLHHIGGHTPGQQSLRVATERGNVVVASDAAHYYESFLDEQPFLTHESMTDLLEGHRTLRRLADSDDHVVPGHDPLVIQRYPVPSPELAGIVACLHLHPTPLDPTPLRPAPPEPVR